MLKSKRTEHPKDSPRRVSRSSQKALAQSIAQIADSKKARDIVILDLRDLTIVADYFVICSTDSEVAVRAVADAIHLELHKKGHKPLHVEGSPRGHWVVIDYGAVIVHVFYEETRQFYDIEGLWADAPRVATEG